MDHLADNEKNPGQISNDISRNNGQFFSALKWWHKYEALNKTSCPVTSEVHEVIKRMIKSYKKDIGEKLRVGVLPMKEGESGLSRAGYLILCKYLCSYEPVG